MNEAVKKIIEKTLEGSYYKKQEDGSYSYEMYADYRDELSNKTAVEILESDYPGDAFYEKMNEIYLDAEFSYRVELEEVIFAAIEQEYTDESGSPYIDNEEVQEYLTENVYYEPPYDHYLKQEFYVNIMVDTGDGNYDFTCNSVYPSYYGDYGATINDKASILWLAKTQGYKKREFAKAMKLGDMANPVGFLQSMRVELANATSHMNTLTFLAKMTLKELITLNQLIKKQDVNGHKYDATENPYCGYITLSKDAETGLYDPWNGGGSVFEIQLEKDLRLPIRFIRSALPDGGDGYSISSVYGMCGTCWRDTAVKNIHIPEKYKELCG